MGIHWNSTAKKVIVTIDRLFADAQQKDKGQLFYAVGSKAAVAVAHYFDTTTEAMPKIYGIECRGVGDEYSNPWMVKVFNGHAYEAQAIQPVLADDGDIADACKSCGYPAKRGGGSKCHECESAPPLSKPCEGCGNMIASSERRCFNCDKAASEPAPYLGPPAVYINGRRFDAEHRDGAYHVNAPKLVHHVDRADGDRLFLDARKPPEGVNSAAWRYAMRAVCELGELGDVGAVVIEKALVAYERYRRGGR